MLPRTKKILTAMAAFAALALGGSAIAGAASSSQTPRGFNGPAPGTAAHENAEKTVTGAAADKARAAAVKAVGSGSAGEVTTDFTGDGYETTVTKSDGTKVEIHLDKSFNVMQGHGGPGHHHGFGPPPAGQP